jgi:hypothetical protein
MATSTEQSRGRRGEMGKGGQVREQGITKPPTTIIIII